MKLITALRDIARYFTALPGMNMVRLIPGEGVCQIAAIDYPHKQVICSQKRSFFHEPIDKIDKPAGIFSANLLAAIFDHPDYANAEATVVRNKLDGKSIMLKGSNGAVHAIELATRFTNFPTVHPFKGASWHLEFAPTSEMIALLSYWTKHAREFIDGKLIHIFTYKGKVNGRFECGPGNFKQFRMSLEGKGELPLQDKAMPHYAFSAQPLLSILKLRSISESTIIRVSKLGVLEVELDSGIAKYSFLFPATKIIPGDYADMFTAMAQDFAEERMQDFLRTGEISNPLPYYQQHHETDEINHRLLYDDRASHEAQ
jgi:hypothetical protein